MAIVGIITVFRCDGADCPVWKSIDVDDQLEEFVERWYVGVHVHFCPGCRVKIENQASIAADERQLTEHAARIAGIVKAKIVNSGPRVRRAVHVH